jgi:2-polyprenyl-6-methoxyphenol hydroxylase-like FAD-dependent oxidoreductase
MTLASVPRYDPDRTRTLGDRAVVAGGSMAGLLAARSLADYFETVTVLEADEYPDELVPRRGVPQGTQVHALQESGRATLEDLFPGYTADLLAAGALQLDSATDLRLYSQGGFLADGPRRLPGYTATRPLFEDVTRRRVASLDGVELRTDCQVVDYTLADATTVDGVVYRDGTGAGTGTESRLGADLVVDATGRTSKTPDWLERNGYDAPSVDEVRIDVGYSTVAVERLPEDRRAFLATAEAPRTRGGLAFPVEGDRWQLNFHGVHGDHPPGDVDGLVEFASTLPVPQLETLLREHSVVTGVSRYPFPSSRRQYYEATDRFPDGLVVVGDAVASFNPVYGQGMSVAALDALQLHHALADGLDGLAARFFDRAGRTVDTAWRMAVGTDAQFDETTGPVPRGSDLFARYFARFTRRAHTDPGLRTAYMRVLSMEQPPTALLQPGVLARVLGPKISNRGLGRWRQSPSGSPGRLSLAATEGHDR